MGIVWLFITYTLVCWVHRARPGRNIPAPSRQTSHTLTTAPDLEPEGIGRYLLTAGIGFGGVWIADLISNGDPIWPGLAIVAAVLGETVPLVFKGASRRIGVSYWGCLLYLDFGVGLTCAGIVLVDMAISKDPLAAQVLLVILAPVLVRYVELNPLFFWMTIAAGFFIILRLKDERFMRVAARPGSGDLKDDEIKLK